MKYTKVCYLCDGCGCNEMCANKSEEDRSKHRCHHTTDEAHAKNKNRRARKFETTMEKNGVVCYVEIERGKKVKYG